MRVNPPGSMSNPMDAAKTSRLLLIFLLGFFALFLHLGWMQVIRGDYFRRLSEKNRIRVVYLEAARGNITDRNGVVIAESRLCFNLSVIPREASSSIERSCRIAGGLLGLEPSELERRFYKGKTGAFNTIVLAEDVPHKTAMALEERLDLLPGFLIETRPQRIYPFGETFSHVTGYTSPLTEEELVTSDLYDYSAADWVGRDGVEKNYEDVLRGRSGGLQIEVNNRGRIVRALGVKEPKAGKDAKLTLDAHLQVHVQELFHSRKGAVAVMELKEGGLLCLASSPAFDPNLFASARGRKNVGKYLLDKDAPLLNRAIAGRYPPGSIFKIVTAFSALRKHKIGASSMVRCAGALIVGGNRFRCWKEGGHGEEELTRAFAHSCNVFFYTTGLLAGFETLAEEAMRFGLAEPTGIDLPGERKGFVPTREWKRRVRHESWYDGETANLSIGQGYLQITPLEALTMVSAVAGKGEVVKPHVMADINGVKVSERTVKKIPLEAGNLALVEAGLRAVVNSDSGTGRLARTEGVEIAGKTGTAQSGQNQTHAWFVGYAPIKKPKVAMVVFLENGGRGGVAAASMASSIFKWLKDASYL